MHFLLLYKYLCTIMRRDAIIEITDWPLLGSSLQVILFRRQLRPAKTNHLDDGGVPAARGAAVSASGFAVFWVRCLPTYRRRFSPTVPGQGVFEALHGPVCYLAGGKWIFFWWYLRMKFNKFVKLILRRYPMENRPFKLIKSLNIRIKPLKNIQCQFVKLNVSMFLITVHSFNLGAYNSQYSTIFSTHFLSSGM